MTPSVPGQLPALPAVYELVRLEQVDGVAAEAARRARQGAGEGTLVWAKTQTDARTVSGKRWEAPEGNLHCAVIIEPDYGNIVAEQLFYVAMIGAGTAIAETVSPMTGLRWRWPGVFYVNDLKSGLVQMAFPEDAADPYPWLVLAVSVNVAWHPPNPEPEEFNSLHASGTPEATVEGLLDSFSRHFLSWINRWAEEGFEPVRKAWTLRADGLGEAAAFRAGGRTLGGTFKGVDPEGRLELALDDGTTRAIRVSEVFAPAKPAGGKKRSRPS